MWKFVKTVACGFWQVLNFLRAAIANLVLLAIVIAAAFWLGQSGPQPVKEKTYLAIDLAGQVVEKTSMSDGLSSLVPSLQDAVPQTRLRDVLEALDKAAVDPDIIGIYLKVDDLTSVGPASIREIGAAMDRFRATNKPIVVWSSSYSQRQYAIAAHASEIYLHPMGQVLVTGLGGTRLYWGDLLQNLGVNVHVFKAGAFKSFPEIFVRNAPSPDAQAADRFWMKDEWSQLASSIETARGLMPGAIDALIASYPDKLKDAAGDMSQVAWSANLIDGVKTRDAVADLIANREGKKAGQEPRLVGYLAYLNAKTSTPPTAAKSAVAVLTLEGDIVDGASSVGSVGANSVASLLRRVKKDPRVAALVVRMDSPGGSAVAAEMIRREIELVKAAGKPVVVSMGDYAASGGYWVSMAANYVVADPMTITGSIGVFGLLPTFENSLKRLGIGQGGERTGWLAGADNLAAPLDPRLETMMNLTVARTYRDFLSLAAAARKLPMDKIESLAQGRVYTGRQAVQFGLADEVGGFADAKAKAAQLAGLQGDVPLIWYDDAPKGWKVWKRWITGAFTEKLAQEGLSAAGLPAQTVMTETQRLQALTQEPGRPLAHCLCVAP